MTFQNQFLLAKTASRQIARFTTDEKNSLLRGIASALEINSKRIIDENTKDVQKAQEEGGGQMVDRLLLNPERISVIVNDVKNVAELADEAGNIIDETVRPNGLRISRIRVPIGVIGMIYESRPNVTVDATALALKSGNAIILKGGKEAVHSNRILVQIMRDALIAEGYSPEVIQFLDTTDRQATAELLTARGLIDVIIPRGGKELIDFVATNAKVPVIETGASVVHTFVDESANISHAVQIVVNEKTRRVSVCNALDTLLVHEAVAESFLPVLAKKLQDVSQKNATPLVKIHADETVLSSMSKVSYGNLFLLKESDFQTEWLDYEMSVKVVKNIDEAIMHIQKYSLGHSESICSENQENKDRFLKEIDAACVYANASTAFSDGAQFGLGAEIGISTQKLHVRGPFALQGLTSTKWVIQGEGQIRG